MKAKWVNGRYGNSSSLDLGIVHLCVERASTRPGGYVWFAAGNHRGDDARYKTEGEAQAAAVAWGRSAMTAALAMLPEGES